MPGKYPGARNASQDLELAPAIVVWRVGMQQSSIQQSSLYSQNVLILGTWTELSKASPWGFTGIVAGRA